MCYNILNNCLFNRKVLPKAPETASKGYQVMGKASTDPNVRKRFIRTFALIAACLALNLLLSFAARKFNCEYFPLYLDCVGTAVAAMLGGPLPAVIVGFATNAINSLFGSTTTLYFGTVSVIFALLVRYLYAIGFFKKFKWILSCLMITVICSAISSVLLWTVHGFSYASEAVAPLAGLIGSSFGFPPFASLFTAELFVNLVDKPLVLGAAALICRLCPKKLKAALAPETYSHPQGSVFHRIREFFRSLPGTVVRTMVLFEVVLCVLVSVIGYNMYRDANVQKYSVTAQNATDVAAHFIDAEKADLYLAERVSVFEQYAVERHIPDEAVADPSSYTEYFDEDFYEYTQSHYSEEYREVERDLKAIGESFTDLEYLYVYDIQEDGCHVMFDIDETAYSPYVGFDESFNELIPSLLRGEEIDPIITDDTYGWLLTVYNPLTDAEGNCRGYVCADISMNDLRVDQVVFVIKVISVLIGASLVVLVAVLNIFENKLVKPINSISRAASEFAFDTDGANNDSLSRLASLDVRSCVEVEQLYDSLKKLAADSVNYIDRIRADAEEISGMQEAIIADFANMVESRDKNTGDHIKKTSFYVERIAGQLRRDGVYADTLTDDYVARIVRSAPLHDIGKITISDMILNKPGRLTDEEYEIMKTHAAAGAEILINATVNIGDNDYLDEAINMAHYHHEWWNGKGYPCGLSGEDIPLSARIMAVADVFDALVSRRSYKQPFTLEKALSIIREETGTHFDPNVTKAFFEIVDDIYDEDEDEK